MSLWFIYLVGHNSQRSAGTWGWMFVWIVVYSEHNGSHGV